MADLIGHPDTYKPTRPGRLFFCPPSPGILVVSALFRRVQLPGRLRQRQVSSWSRLCSADSVGSIPPNVYFVLLRRTRIHRAPPSNVAEGGHARRDQRTPAVLHGADGLSLALRFSSMPPASSPLRRNEGPKTLVACSKIADRQH